MKAQEPGAATYDQKFFASIVDGSLESARVVAPLVLEMTRARSVVDFGCGTGAWLKAFQENGVEDILGLDGNYVRRDELLIDPNYFNAVDLENGTSLAKTYDLAICLEVVEHLHPRASRSMVRSLVEAAPIVLFSAAIPGQGGTNHANEQWPNFWRKLFAEHQYQRIDSLRPAIWQNERVKWWYRQNAYLYANQQQYDVILSRLGVPADTGFELIRQSVLDGHTTMRGMVRETIRSGIRTIRKIASGN